MANRFCVSLTHAKDNADKATVGFVVANAAVGSGKETLVFLSVEGVRLAQRGYADDVQVLRAHVAREIARGEVVESEQSHAGVARDRGGLRCGGVARFSRARAIDV